MTEPTRATFATNREERGEIVATAINGHLDWLGDTWKKPFTVAIATAYVNPGGFALLEDALSKAQMVRLLIGAEPEPPIARIRSLAEEDTTVKALEGHDRSLEEDRNLLEFTQKADASARRFADWLRSGVVEVRRFEQGFLHGKAYLVDTDDEGVIAGSSNFTYAGLARNHELNLGHYQPETVKPFASGSTTCGPCRAPTTWRRYSRPGSCPTRRTSFTYECCGRSMAPTSRHWLQKTHSVCT